MNKLISITQKELKKLLSYNPETGLFTWKVDKRPVRKGRVAGSKTSEGYIQIVINYKRYLAHRLAFLYTTGSFPEKYTDHINGNKKDNRFRNLRQASGFQNMCNRSKQKNNTSGIRGVRRQGKKYEARANFQGESYRLGLFPTPKEASKAYQEFTKEKYGEFYCEK